MQIARSFSPLMRAIFVIGAVAALVTSITFAALSSTATLTDNEISSATATLKVDGPDANPNNSSADFSTSELGYTFSGLIPGGDFSAPQELRLLNEGNVDLDVTVYATVGTISGAGSLDKTKVLVRFTNNSPSGTATYTLAQLEAVFNDVPGAGGASETLPDGELENLTVEVKLDDGAVVGSGPVTINDFDLVFTGTNEAEL